MKKTILLLLLLTYYIGLLAQDFSTTNLEAYIGTWEYSNGTEIFRIVLKKGKRYWRDGSFKSDEIYGGHYYKKDGKVITDCTQEVIVSTQSNSTMSIRYTINKQEPEVIPNELNLFFDDDLHNKSGYGTLTLIPGNPARLHWKIEGMFEVVIFPIPGEPLPVILPGWSVPVDVVLTKVPE